MRITLNSSTVGVESSCYEVRLQLRLITITGLLRLAQVLDIRNALTKGLNEPRRVFAGQSFIIGSEQVCLSYLCLLFLENGSSGHYMVA